MSDRPQTPEALRQHILTLAHAPEDLLHQLPQLLPYALGPRLDFFEPIQGYPGTMLEIHGHHFSADGAQNEVTVGGVPALVVEASATRLLVIAGLSTETGPVKVAIGSRCATGPVDFTVHSPVTPGAGDGPPLFYEGRYRSTPESAVRQPKARGTLHTLVALCYAADRVPPEATTVRSKMISEFAHASAYYDEVSFGATDLKIDCAEWVPLTGSLRDYVSADTDNFVWPTDRMVAEAAQHVTGQGFQLDGFDFFTVVLFMNGAVVHGWNGWSQSNFSYTAGPELNINITVDHEVGIAVLGERADWGRLASALAQSLVTRAAVLDEDVCRSELIDPDAATAIRFDLLGSHDSHPCFSGHFMHQLGYYEAANVCELTWDGNAFTRGFTLVAHGLTQNTNPARRHLVKINVGGGVCYYIEVRERMTSAHFDRDIPVSGVRNGGVVVTKVITDRVSDNQELRALTLLHDAVTQDVGAIIKDAERALTISVTGVAQTNPLALHVRVAWAQVTADNVNGTFDVQLGRSQSRWAHNDIWVDHQPFSNAQETNFRGHGEIVAEPARPGEVNHVYAQVFNSGPDDATDVKLTFYAVSPPGIGDNGAGTPIGQRTLPVVMSGSVASAHVSWIPRAGECASLMVRATPQFGEITAGNNQALDNAFHFAPCAAGTIEPVRMRIAVRNPLADDATILLAPARVPAGYLLHVPHRWLNVPAKGERTLDLTVIPHLDFETYRSHPDGRSANIRVLGFLPNQYQNEVEGTGVPVASVRAVGSLIVNITPKQQAELVVEIDAERQDGIGITGSVRPALGGQKITVCVQPAGSSAFRTETVTDRRGRFRVFIDPRREMGQTRRPWEGQRAQRLDGIFEVYCETFDAQDLAFARSPRLYFDFRHPGKLAARTDEPPIQEAEAAVARPRHAPELVDSVLQQTLGDEPVPATTRTERSRRYRRR
ncbi:MAG: IPT/TIG domain-containing protein [Longimicrobiales bacterium]